MIILDTDHISVLQYEDSPTALRLQAHLEGASPREVATTAITVEEQTRSWLGLIRRYTDVHRQVPYYDRLIRLFDFFAGWSILPFDERAADEFKRLRDERIRIATMDLKIASIALANDATLLSRNLRDFETVPGLQIDNWLST